MGDNNADLETDQRRSLRLRGRMGLKLTSRSLARSSPWVLLIVLELGGICAFWVFDALPFVDLSGHAGVFALHKLLLKPGFEHRFFVFWPHLGEYSLFRFLGDTLTRWSNPVTAVRVLGTLPLVATPLAVLLARYRLYGDISPFFPTVGIILCFGYLTMMGLASYMLAIPLLLIVLAEWLRLMSAVDRCANTLASEVTVALLAMALFLTHGYAFFVFGFIAGVTAISAGSVVGRLWRLRDFLPATVLVSYSVWAERAANMPANIAPLPASFALYYDPILNKLGLILTPTLFSRTGVDLLIGVSVWIVVIGGVSISNRATSQTRQSSAPDRRDYIRVLTVACIGTFLLFLVMPHSIGWFSFSDARLLPIVIFLGLLAIDTNAFSPKLRHIAVHWANVSAVATIGLFLWASHVFQSEASGYRQVFSAIPAYSRVLYLPLDSDSRIFVQHSFSRYDGLLLAEKPVLPSQTWFQSGTAIYPTAANPILRLPSEYVPASLHRVVWKDYRLHDWDYVVIRQNSDGRPPMTPRELICVDHYGSWWLFRNRTKRT